jgi:tungstate transport system substrate-binding protein
MRDISTFCLALLFGVTGVSVSFAAPPVVRMATTTSTENSGLFSELLPPFEKRSGISLQIIAVGTGKALQMGRDGDVDLVFVHAREAEEAFVAENHGVNWRAVMYNDFVIVGPGGDPAGVGVAPSASSGLGKIATAPALFVSRGDDSGTHRKERQLWAKVGIEPNGEWYRETGQGMGKTLQIADELQAYALVDRGTWLAYRGRLQLSILSEGDPALYNPYGILAVNPAKYPDINYQGAMQAIAWVTSVPGQRIIKEFRVEGMPLFRPLAVAP